MQSNPVPCDSPAHGSEVSGDGTLTHDSQTADPCDGGSAGILRTGSNQVLVAQGHMLKLAGGRTHLQTPAGIATSTPHRLTEPAGAAVPETPVPETPQGSGNSAIDQARQLSQECSEGPQNSWSNVSKMQADKRRRLNRESAQRTRKRKQEQTQQLETEVASLRSEDLFKGERIKSLTTQLEGLTTDNKKLQLDKQIMMKCMGEITAVCKSKEAALAQLHHQIRHAGSIKDVRLPMTDQVENQLSPDSLQFWHGQKSQQGLSLQDEPLAAQLDEPVAHLDRSQSMPPPSLANTQAQERRLPTPSHARITPQPRQGSSTPMHPGTPRFTSMPRQQQLQPTCTAPSQRLLPQSAYNQATTPGNTHTAPPGLVLSGGPGLQHSAYTSLSHGSTHAGASDLAPSQTLVLQQSQHNGFIPPGNTQTAPLGLAPSQGSAHLQSHHDCFIPPGNPQTAPSGLTPSESPVLQQSHHSSFNPAGNPQTAPSSLIASEDPGLQQGTFSNSISVGNTLSAPSDLEPLGETGLQQNAYSNFAPPANPQAAPSSLSPLDGPGLQQGTYSNPNPLGKARTAPSEVGAPERSGLQQGTCNSSMPPGNPGSLTPRLNLRDNSLPEGQLLGARSLSAPSSILSKHSAQLQQKLIRQGKRIMAVHAANVQHRLNTGQPAPAFPSLVPAAPAVSGPVSGMQEMLSRTLSWTHSQCMPQQNFAMMQAGGLQTDMVQQPDYLQEMYDAHNATFQQPSMQQAGGYATNSLADQPGSAYPPMNPNGCSPYASTFS